MTRTSRAWIIYTVGVFAYVIAVMQRTSIGVAGVAATSRFHVDAAALSSLAVLQLGVYAAMQVPVGVLIDRYGPRRIICTGTACMLIGQIVVGLAPHIGVAVIGRILVGAGDATVFTSVMRLTASWFEGPIVAQLSQWISNLGQIGQILSAVPFALLLRESGWTVAFLSAASCSLLAAIVLVAAIADQPPGAPTCLRPTTFRHSWQLLRTAMAHPGTRLGFWSHYSSQSSGTIFSLMWGYPFMVYALDYAPANAAALLIVPVAAAVIAGPVLGLLSAHYPLRRSNVILTVIAIMGVAWTVVLVWPGMPPPWLIITLLVTIGIGGPGSMIGFDYARTFNPAQRLGSANGIVNTGGFIACVVMIFGIGLVLDWHNALAGGHGPRELYSLTAFRVAFLVQYVVVGVGIAFIIRERRLARRYLAENEGIAVGPLWVAIVKHWRLRHSATRHDTTGQ